MTTLTKPSIGLTQFTDFTMKGSAAKTKFVKDIKYQGEYHPIKDYWKALRDGLKNTMNNALTMPIYSTLWIIPFLHARKITRKPLKPI